MGDGWKRAILAAKAIRARRQPATLDVRRSDNVVVYVGDYTWMRVDPRTVIVETAGTDSEIANVIDLG